MRKTLVLSVAAATMLSLNLMADETEDKINAMQTQIEALQSELDAVKSTQADSEESLEYFDKKISDLNRNTNGNHLKFGVDFRTSFHSLNYKMASDSIMTPAGPMTVEDSYDNTALLANRLWIDMAWAATDNLSFTGQLAYNKFFGQRSGVPYGPFENFDWIVNENPYDDTIRVRKAYFFYRDDTLFGIDTPWTFSIGRRPSTNGHLANFREDDPASSPMAHTVNVEFDGLSAKLSLENLTWDGHYFKLCAGRGLSNANGRFFTVNTQTGAADAITPAYAEVDGDLPDIDMLGFIWVPYDDGQYSLNTQYTYAWNLIDAQMAQDPASGAMMLNGMENVGDEQSVTANIIVNGIGDEWSDYLDDSIFFVSGAMTITDPKKDGQGMVGDLYGDMLSGNMTADGRAESGLESQTGYSAWVGLQVPSLISDGGRWGAEWNWGSQYWRPVTYGEDTLIGSKVATRGNAYEVYFTEYLVENILSLQLRYTYLDYDYTGSNGFFGTTSGHASSLDDVKKAGMGGAYVDTASEFRAYLRYRF